MSILKTIYDPNGRYQIVKVKLGKEIFTLVNIYGPNNDDPLFFNTFFSKLLHHSNTNIIIGGDFNIVLNNVLDKLNGPKHNNQKAQKEVKDQMKTLNLIDVFRELYPNKKEFTRFQSNSPTATRLDFFLTAKNFFHES